MALSQFPVRVPIGRAEINGQPVIVLMTPEFARAINTPALNVTGSLSDGTATQSLINALVTLGFITDSTLP